MGYRGSANSAALTLMPPRAANSHSTSVGSRTKPEIRSSLAALLCMLAQPDVVLVRRAQGVEPITLVTGKRPSEASGFGHCAAPPLSIQGLILRDRQFILGHQVIAGLRLLVRAAFSESAGDERRAALFHERVGAALLPHLDGQVGQQPAYRDDHFPEDNAAVARQWQHDIAVRRTDCRSAHPISAWRPVHPRPALRGMPATPAALKRPIGQAIYISRRLSAG